MLFLLFLLLGSAASQSCDGRCGEGLDESQPCQCNDACISHNDCCPDFPDLCQADLTSCKGKCGANYDPSLPCECNDKCQQYGNCCIDYDEECGGGGGGGLTDLDLLDLGEILIAQDENNVAGLYTLDLGCQINFGDSNDCSPNPLFQAVDPSVLELPIYKALAKLYDNYNNDPSLVEDHTEEEQMEENEFINEVLASAVMNTTYNFLFEKGAFTGTWEDWGRHLYDTWFGMYDRAKTILGSSGFEHVFIGECCKGGEVGGFHNWYHYYMLEAAGLIDYRGYMEYVSLGRGDGITMSFTWNGTPKPIGGGFVGTSPSLELALYTTCLLTRPNAKCHVTLGGQDVYIQTWEEKVGGNIYVGSSYPAWSK